jgi:hypothetical protein
VKQVDEPTYRVVWPLGRTSAQSDLETQGSLQSLNGKTVAFLWDFSFRGDEMFAVIQHLISSHSPEARFVGPNEFGDIHGSPEVEHQVIASLPDKLRQYRVDAAIVGVGA